MKRVIALLLVLCMTFALAACGQKAPAPTTPQSGSTNPPTGGDVVSTEPPVEENLTETQKIIKQAQTMTLEELAQKAIEESNGKMFYGVGNSSRGKSALPLFIAYLQTIDPATTWTSSGSSPRTTRSLTS